MPRIVLHIVSSTLFFTGLFVLFHAALTPEPPACYGQSSSLRAWTGSSHWITEHDATLSELEFSPYGDRWYGSGQTGSHTGTTPVWRSGRTYLSSDGALVPVSVNEYSSNERAQAAWYTFFGNVDRVVELRPEVSRRNGAVGLRAVLMISPNGDVRPARIVTLRGSEIQMVNGPSLEHVYALERSFRSLH